MNFRIGLWTAFMLSILVLIISQFMVMITTPPPASASCRISVTVTHPRDQYFVQAEINNGCGHKIQAIGDWGGENDYGSYLYSGYSVACDISSCQGHPDGTLFHGGWKDRRTGKIHWTF